MGPSRGNKVPRGLVHQTPGQPPKPGLAKPFHVFPVSTPPQSGTTTGATANMRNVAALDQTSLRLRLLLLCSELVLFGK